MGNKKQYPTADCGKLQFVEQILMAHFYTGQAPYVRSVRLNAPDT